MRSPITDTLETFTIRQVAELWAEETGQGADLIERALIKAAERYHSNEHGIDHELELVVVRLDADNKGLTPEELEAKVQKRDEDLLAYSPGLYVEATDGKITQETAVRRNALIAWCEQEGIHIPSFIARSPPVPTIRAEARAQKWLQELVETVQSGTETQRTKDQYRQTAQVRFPGLSTRGFGRIWDMVVPSDWKRAGRPRKS